MNQPVEPTDETVVLPTRRARRLAEQQQQPQPSQQPQPPRRPAAPPSDPAGDAGAGGPGAPGARAALADLGPRRTAIVVGAALVGMLVLGLLARFVLVPGLVGADEVEPPSRGAVALTTGQARAAYARADARAQDAEAKRTPEAAQTAYTGPMLQASAARWKVAAAAKQAPSPVPAPLQTVSQPAGQGYPRYLLAQTKSSSSRPVSVRLLTTGDAFTPYKVWADTTLLPGASLPALGSAPAPAADDGTGLVASPQDVVAAYGRLLTTGKPGKDDPEFAEDRFLSDVRANATGQANDVARFATFTQTHAPDPKTMWTARTKDGGALVVAALTRTDTFTVKPGTGTLAAPEQYKALAAEGSASKITKTATVRTLEVVMIVVPPSGPAQVVAAAEQPVSVTAR